MKHSETRASDMIKYRPAFKHKEKNIIISEPIELSSNTRHHTMGVRRNNDNSTIFKCKYCGKAFTQKSNLTTHIRGVHESDRTIKCELCDMYFCTSPN